MPHIMPGAQALDCLSLLYNLGHRPRLGFGYRAAFLDLDGIASFGNIRLIVSVIFVRANNDLAVKRMTHAALNQNGHRLVHLVGYDSTDQRALERFLLCRVHY